MNRMSIFTKLITIILLSTISPSISQQIEDLEYYDEKVWNDLPFCVQKDYRKDVAPLTNKPLNISIMVQFDDIIEVNDKDATVTFKVVLSISWTDRRLNLIHNSSSWNDDSNKWARLSVKCLNYLWIPDMNIPNIKEFNIQNILKRQGAFTLYEDKRLWYEFPVQITLTCPLFDFKTYPLDEQVCKFFIGGYQYDVEKCHYKGKMSYNKNRQRPLQYKVKEMVALSFEDGLLNYEIYYHTIDEGMQYENITYSHFGIKMVFTRPLQQHFICTFFPSFLLVVISWLGFLIEPASVPGRIALTVTLLLVLVNMR